MNVSDLYKKYNTIHVPRDEEIQGTFLERTRQAKNEMLPLSETKHTVVILGAGPAGLIRAITSIMNGNPTYIIEKRADNASSRENTVKLETETIYQLMKLGAYQYLLENKLIFPVKSDKYFVNSLDVRLGDLEKALKAVLKELKPDQEIYYSSTLQGINDAQEKLSLLIETVDHQRRFFIDDVGILVNTEGSRSTTNTLLGINRISVLPNKPAIAAIFKDYRPRIRGLGSFFVYIGVSIAYIARTVYYHTLFIFKFIFSKYFRRECLGVILKTPGQVYIGCGFSPRVNKRISELKTDIIRKGDALAKAANPKEKSRCQQALKSAKNRYRSFLHMRANLGLCAANFLNLFYAPRGHKITSKHLSYVKCEAIDIGADRADTFALMRNQSAILLAGDAAATVDPSTGLGCNTALQSNEEFLAFLQDVPNEEQGENINDSKVDVQIKEESKTLEEKIKDYQTAISQRVEFIHNVSYNFRSRFDQLIARR